ncbi:MAG: copper homeostasis protein CutC [Haliscomenobacter sp.]|nr:copper homeostasis protein CutC [Haliscomenobacter sp.]MBK8877958.1 copper homeostasis protein CutC [Haliscomenobacter sp.]
MDLLKEVCVDTPEQALRAQAQGAQRIELCARLDLDGLTPDPDFIRFALTNLEIPVHVMIRPRGGDFVYSPEEVVQMREAILLCKRAGAPGVVFGALRPDGSLNLALILELALLAKPMNVVIHKAIDQTPDPVEALGQLLDLGVVDKVLTSGGAPTARDGAQTLQEMLNLAAGRLEIIVAGKVTNENLEDLHQVFGAREYHGRRIVGEVA